MVKTKSIIDMTAGAFMVLLAVAFGVEALSYELGTPGRMNPGFFPFLCSVILGLLGVVIFVGALRAARDVIQVDWRAFLFIGGSIAVFAASIEHIGFIPATFCAVIISSFSERGGFSMMTLVAATILSAILWLVFIAGLGLQAHSFHWNF